MKFYWQLAMECEVPFFNWYRHVDGHMLYEFGEPVAYLYYVSKGVQYRGKGRIVTG